ncbi:hypothetical protein ACFXDE_34420 [Kitasatospora sp. NPDC059408]|uniref:hypothetical protein n=1 Tax=Kitasatospora sp. NPDC059408 TaxID=3346823 RepID=UPI0036AC8EE9
MKLDHTNHSDRPDYSDRENDVVLQALQATLGLITENVNAIAVQAAHDRIVLHFSISRNSPEFEEDVEDIEFDLDAILEGRVLIESQVHLGPPDDSWPGRAWRLIYLANSRRSRE